MLNSKILILCNELREMSIHISLCLKFQKISRINKNRENKYLRYYEYTRESTKISILTCENKYQKKLLSQTYFIALCNKSR